jgi:hypothetical protein
MTIVCKIISFFLELTLLLHETTKAGTHKQSQFPHVWYLYAISLASEQFGMYHN